MSRAAVARALRAPADRCRVSAPALDKLGSALAIALLVVMAAATAAEQQAVDTPQSAVPANAGGPGAADVAGGETMIAGYFGAPFTYPSEIHIDNLKSEATSLTLKNVSWDGKPFKSPVYYGVRIARWLPGNRTGTMVDFTHSKTITRPEEEVELAGLIKGAPAPAKARIGAMFKHLEFSHGHNMLTFNGLWRLANLTPRISPYIGVGGGVALPHTEVEMTGEGKRTYEYQFAGPVAQALVGIEFRLPGVPVRLGTSTGAAPPTSLFFEYKFSLAGYVVPLSRLEGNLLFTDVWRQARLWWQGDPPPGGHLATTLASHQIIGGAGVRLGSGY